jgi:hypothetical protein
VLLADTVGGEDSFQSLTPADSFFYE